MLSRCDFRHDAAVSSVYFYLGADDVGENLTAILDDRVIPSPFSNASNQLSVVILKISTARAGTK